MGVGDDFRKTYPQTPYTRIAPEKPLPFDDGTFDVATSNAVLEHVGSRENQRRFISELCRVAHTVFLTVPHRYFPVEHHTALPILHYSDTSFAVACRLIGKTYWLDETNLILMSKQHLTSLAPVNSKIGYTGLRIGPFSSNLYLFLDARRKASS
ncbi:class I SAM-dependent methyltransferase [Aurantimonas litoralis]|nr:class I SAM-dependent methyltransferase [Aurantimonas litoralis]